MVVTALDVRPLGCTGIPVTAVSVGTSPLSMPALYGNAPDSHDREQAIATVLAAIESGVRLLDTSNEYGGGESERIVGEALRRYGGLPDDILLASKVDPDPMNGDFSGRRVRASVAESMDRLGVDHVRLMYLHDPERIGFEESMARGGPVEALVELQRGGVIGHLGVAGGAIPLLHRFVDTGVFAVVLSHNRYSLLDRSAAGLYAAAYARGLGVVNAAPFGSGMLAKGPVEGATYAYGPGSDEVRSTVVQMAAICGRYGVSLASAALHFSIRNPNVHSTTIGASRPSRITAAVQDVQFPEGIWDDLEALTPDSSLWLD